MIPDKLSADYSENYEVSIRLMPGGLSFSGYIPTERDSFFSETFSFDNNLPAVDSLKNIFFTNPCFSYNYRSCYVICVSVKYTLTPDPVFKENEKIRLFNFCHSKTKSLKVLVHPVKTLNIFLSFGIDEDIYAFLVRSLATPQFIHPLSPVLNYWQKKSLMLYPKQMHVMIREDMIDVICMQQGDLLFANSFFYDSDSDIIYYIMYICRQTGFNQVEDCLSLSGNLARRQSVLSIIHKYISKTTCFQPELKDHPSTVGLNVPMDMVALIECGL